MMQHTGKKDNFPCELLAPAGSVESFKAAINAGADAVYIGGSMFGARAFADNPDEENLIKCIEYAHLHGKKIYLTLNTLLKNDELTDRLYSYFRPYYDAGADAVIVQDYGVLKFIGEYFPGINIHASTQMGIMDSGYASLLKEEGVSRIVTARELSLGEIAAIHKNTGLEIESFVHGAMCYCYSGMCMFSSIAGGRSGNRGRCAQPCRMAYILNNGDDFAKNGHNPEYILSPKDLCAIDILPDILEAGVYSLKIEGRMKNPPYVAATVSVYRKYIDRLNTYGKDAYKTEDADRAVMLDIYNRGNFTEGYYRINNSCDKKRVFFDMITHDRPNHRGIAVLKKMYDSKAGAVFDVIRDINKGDIIEIGDKSITIPDDYKKGEKFVMKRSGGNISKERNSTGSTHVGNGSSQDALLYRVRNNKLIEDITAEYIKKSLKIKIKGIFTATADNAIFIVTHDKAKVSFCARISDMAGNVDGVKGVQKAVNNPLTEEDVRKRLMKTGNVEFEFEDLEIYVEDGIFISIKECNDLRRFAIEGLREEILKNHRRTDACPYNPDEERKALKKYCAPAADIREKKYPLHCLVSDKKQFDAAVKSPCTDRIYIELSEFTKKHDIETCAAKAHASGKSLYVAMPYIFRDGDAKYIDSMIRENKTVIEEADGFLIRTLSEYKYLKEKYGDKKCNMVFDYYMYAYNTYSRKFLKKYSPEMLTAPTEPDCRELAELDVTGCEMPVYGHLPLMISAGCISRECWEDAICYLQDRLGNNFPVKAVCAFCYNIIYNAVPLSLLNVGDDIKKLDPASLRLDFTSESAEMTSKIINDFYNVLINNENIPRDFRPGEYTKGHFKRKID